MEGPQDGLFGEVLDPEAVAKQEERHCRSTFVYCEKTCCFALFYMMFFYFRKQVVKETVPDMLETDFMAPSDRRLLCFDRVRSPSCLSVIFALSA